MLLLLSLAVLLRGLASFLKTLSCAMFSQFFRRVSFVFLAAHRCCVAAFFLLSRILKNARVSVMAFRVGLCLQLENAGLRGEFDIVLCFVRLASHMSRFGVFHVLLAFAV